MPGLDEKKPEIAGAICAPADATGNAQSALSQPRQPTSLQGLLRFCMEATKAEDAPHDSQFQPMDEERRKWLEEAMNSMTIDVIELLRKQITILENVDKIKSDDDITEYEDAVETILDQIDNIDVACDFHKIGGFMVLEPCLKSPHPKMRVHGCEILAVLCQHNPYCQRVVLDNEFVSKLLDIVEKDENLEVRIKALYGLSAMVRHNQEGYNQFINYNGPSILLKSLSGADCRVITKATFLLNSICGTQPDFKSRLVFLDYVPTLISLMSKERQSSHEHVLSLLATLVEDNATAISECRNPRHNLQQVLQKYIETCENKEECIEEIQHSRRILYLVFGYN